MDLTAEKTEDLRLQLGKPKKEQFKDSCIYEFFLKSYRVRMPLLYPLIFSVVALLVLLGITALVFYKADSVRQITIDYMGQ